LSVADSAFVVNLIHRQQRKLYLPVFERRYLPTALHSSRVEYNHSIATEECSFVHSLLWTFYNSCLHLLTQFYEEAKRDWKENQGMMTDIMNVP